MKTLTRPRGQNRYINEALLVERSVIRNKANSYAHKTEHHDMGHMARSAIPVSAQISALLNRIRVESNR